LAPNKTFFHLNEGSLKVELLETTTEEEELPSSVGDLKTGVLKTSRLCCCCRKLDDIGK